MEREMVYLDHSATTQVDEEVMDTYVRANLNFWGNASSLHNFGALAEQVLIRSSRQMLTLLNANDHQMIFTSGATESNNLAIKGLAPNHLRGHVITTQIEHPSVYEVCLELEKKGLQMSYLDVKQSVAEMIRQLEEMIRPDTFLVSCMHVNSEMGLVLPIEEIGKVVAKYPRVKFHVDAVQSVGKLPVDMASSQIDLLSASAHKIHGIKGMGCLVVRKGLRLLPQIAGGGQMDGLRSGTVHVAGAASFAKAMRLVIEGQAEAFKRMQRLFDYTVKQLRHIEGVQVNSQFSCQSPYIVNFYVQGIRGETLVHALSEHDVYVSAKSACSSKSKKASYVLLALGFDEQVATESLRVSFAQETTLEEIDAFLEVLREEVKRLR
ncbi:MAG: cysteine desulfurase [Defluviitaleaceae bacterium]|nr:cysteine desulfurase [Defluviitaleaceae bacterium]